MPKVGDLVAGKYVVEQLIGIGGMGAVFAAQHRFTGKRVALKWMLPELAKDTDAVARFMREAHAAGRINHPNVVDVYDVGQDDSAYFLVMEYLQGEPLTSALARRDMTASELLVLLLPAMRGVAAAHRQGVVHRDLKPDNIFLAYEQEGTGRQAKVLDFGISKLSNEGTLDARLTKTGAVVGTPYYMSPEQIRGSTSLDKRADVYAFGVILYEALTGQVPFHAETYGALILEIATSTPPAPRDLVPNLSGELSRIVLRAMARDPGQRYPDMESLIAAVEPHARGLRGTHTGLRNSATGVRNSYPLDETRIEPAPGPAVATLPKLASTPFAFEAPTSSRPTAARGWMMFGAAAVAIVGGVWFATREPDASTSVTPPNIVTPAKQPPPTAAAPSSPPTTTTIQAATTPQNGLPGAANSEPTLPRGSLPGAPPPPTFARPQSAGAIKNSPSNAFVDDGVGGSRRSGRSSKYSATPRTTVRERKASSASSTPAESKPAPGSTPRVRPRAGAMDESEFL